MEAIMEPVHADFRSAIIAFIKSVMKLVEKITQPQNSFAFNHQPFIA